jgi:hypothetical protein
MPATGSSTVKPCRQPIDNVAVKNPALLEEVPVATIAVPVMVCEPTVPWQGKTNFDGTRGLDDGTMAVVAPITHLQVPLIASVPIRPNTTKEKCNQSGGIGGRKPWSVDEEHPEHIESVLAL